VNQERMFLNQDCDFHLSVKLQVNFDQKIITYVLFGLFHFKFSFKTHLIT